MSKAVTFFNHLKLESPIEREGSTIDGFEIHPCEVINTTKIRRGNSIEEIKEYAQCDEDSPNIAVWGVYVHFSQGGLENIVDAPTKEDAEDFVAVMKKIIANYKPAE